MNSQRKDSPLEGSACDSPYCLSQILSKGVSFGDPFFSSFSPAPESLKHRLCDDHLMIDPSNCGQWYTTITIITFSPTKKVI